MTTSAAPAPWPGLLALPDLPARLAFYAGVARWAPSKHNSQPWRFVLRPACLEVWADPARLLPETDARHRELVLSCGAALHLAAVAARATGRRPAVTLLPEGDGALMGRLEEAGDWTTTDADRALLAAVPGRRTDRGPLDGQLLAAGLPFLLQDAATAEGAVLRLVATPGDRATLADLVVRADRLLVRRPGTDRELAHWLREPGDPRHDGVPTDHTRGPAESYRAEFVQRDFSSERSRPAASRGVADRPLVAVLCTPGDGPRDWLVAGQALAAVLLLAQVEGAHASYLNQPVEEPAVRVLLRDQLTLPGPAQMVVRLGLGSDVTPPPRRGVHDVTFTVRDEGSAR